MSDAWQRYAIYYLPPAGVLAEFGARWLGWDVAGGMACAQTPEDAALTQRARKYGFHATLKAPFRLAEGHSPEALHEAVANLAAGQRPARADGLRLDRIGRFMALEIAGDSAEIDALAAACVTGLDHMRAPLRPADLERRRAARLTPAQDALLLDWGYPYVLAEFRFHMTLTGPVPPAQADAVRDRLARELPPLPRPFVIEQIALVGEAEDGNFHLIDRFALQG